MSGYNIFQIILQWSKANVGWIVIVLIVFLSILDISKIKVDPWKAIIRKISSISSKEMMEQISAIKTEIAEMKKDIDKLDNDIEEHKQDSVNKEVNDMRWNILSFASQVHTGKRKFSKEHWEHVMDQLIEYERYIKAHNIPNGRMDAEGKYLRDKFQEKCNNNDFSI